MARANEVKLFGKWSYDSISVGDISVQDFIAVNAKDQVRSLAAARCGVAWCRASAR